MLIGIISIAVCRSGDSVFLGLFDDVLHVLDVLDGHRHKLLQQTRGTLVLTSAQNPRIVHVLVHGVYLSVQQVPVDILDQLPHCFLQTPEQLLLPVKYFISHLWTSSIGP